MTETIYYSQIRTEDGAVFLAATEQALCYVSPQNEGIRELKSWLERHYPGVQLVEDEEKLSIYTTQLQEYLNGEREEFTLPVELVGTDFQKAVWTELRNIPFGEIHTYSEIAESIGNPRAVRAVGSAIGANPLLFVVPCHRVVRKNGEMGGFRGGLSMKEKLLGLERHKAKI
ncbi:methylated-DNA--[protein]-cysteine S-methyltransferase [Lederbergia galactosidilytica]|uniref:Methylated-DNA--protein-cysteine methyltransferase n=1 Tax=Lederbergia galactosidilytica TaxID=217031 RepID=A0A177ZLR8_9BACI|nr:methylated-DNA--[protein]-cysteine S-methyltransferase [Lederbergia galactosidilytica]KRG08883.1 cysteine methyltransferase [Virgibacillus soli]OAK68419.1 cysteine methyltransferase [Lederbergia galactosidilytica]